MRKLLALGGAVAAIGLSAIAIAGPATTDEGGKVLAIDMDLSPPQASSTARPRGVTINYHLLYTNRKTAEKPEPSESIVLQLVRGLRSNGARFPKCRLAATNDEIGETSRCPAGSQVGSGSAEADARPAAPEPINASVRAFNGPLRNGNPTLLVMARAIIGGRVFDNEVNLEYRTGRRGPALVEFKEGPPGNTTGLFALSKLSLRVGKTATVRAGGGRRTISLWEAPTTCRGAWRFQQTLLFSGGRTLGAVDDAPCVPAPRRP